MTNGGTRSGQLRRRSWSAADVQEALVISGQIPLWLVDGDDRIAFVNEAAVRLLGYHSDDELIGRPSHDTVHWKHPDGSPFPAEDCPITHATRRGEPVVIERDWWVRKDGSMLPISIHCVQMEIDGRMGTAMTFHDQTASVQAENERRALEVQRARLAEVRASRTRIVEAGDAQRRRVVRDLHDGAQASLVRVVLALRIALDGGGVSGEVRPMVDEALENAGSAIDELRELAHGIHPAALTQHGLASAIEGLAERAPVPVVVEIPRERYADSVESAAYFVASEALTNVAKYARASTARVTLTDTDSQLVLTVDDDGVGGARPSAGGGLAGLADRVAAVEGTIHLTSDPGEGTHIRVEIPLTPAPESAATAGDDSRSEASVLIVDDDAKFRALAGIMLRSRGFEILGESSDAASAVAMAVEHRPTAIVLDLNLPDHDGFWVAQRLNEAGVGARILLTSSMATDVLPSALDRHGIVAFISKAELPTTDLSALLR
ncbi:response regulator [Solirubrobacter ginsenosidimutans]|uniref:histidine kinase n=1 Tax=Solirubrobacter ginsenosidimutans TaxID=490573 RepID=A0A9X3S3J4_9ACTN|nr:response regulator [Solirubrobacter ginsenosidimutans]MDA0159568.1 response regulator [Solirubrobacter ginsenosidimutans]